MSQKRGLDMDTILNAAAELAEEAGLENVTLLQVAEKLGVKSPSLYNHVSGLKDLSAGMAKLSINKLEETIRNAAVGRGGAQALEEMAFAYRKFAKTTPELYKAFIHSAALEDPNIGEASQSLVRVVYRVLESYDLCYEDQIHFTRMFRSNLHGFVSLEAAGFFHKEVDANETFSTMVKSYIELLGNRKSTETERRE